MLSALKLFIKSFFFALANNIHNSTPVEHKQISIRLGSGTSGFYVLQHSRQFSNSTQIHLRTKFMTLLLDFCCCCCIKKCKLYFISIEVPISFLFPQAWVELQHFLHFDFLVSSRSRQWRERCWNKMAKSRQWRERYWNKMAKSSISSYDIQQMSNSAMHITLLI